MSNNKKSSWEAQYSDFTAIGALIGDELHFTVASDDGNYCRQRVKLFNEIADVEAFLQKEAKEYFLEIDKVRVVYSTLDEIKVERTSKGITQQEMADYLGVTRRHYTRLENGDRMMSLYMYLKIRSRLDYSDVFEGKSSLLKTKAIKNGTDGE